MRGGPLSTAVPASAVRLASWATDLRRTRSAFTRPFCRTGQPPRVALPGADVTPALPGSE